jgi:hypothetical protein
MRLVGCGMLLLILLLQQCRTGQNQALEGAENFWQLADSLLLF